MKDWSVRMRTAATVAFLLLIAAPVAGSIEAPAPPECPFAEKRPPVDEILKLPPRKRPPLCRANLGKANLFQADLSGAYLSNADLSGAVLGGANLSNADLSGAYLSRGNLFQANLSGAFLFQANLRGADLRGANLMYADLSGAYLSKANLSGADLTEVNLTSTFFEPDPQSLNSVVAVDSARGLDQLRFRDSPTALVVLRERFAKAGFRDLERQVNRAGFPGGSIP